MPNYFQLYAKGDETNTAVAFAVIDEQLCQMLGKPVDEVHYVYGWFDIIGYACATSNDGLGSPEMDERLIKVIGDWPEMMQIYNYLKEHYTSSAWYSPIK